MSFWNHFEIVDLVSLISHSIQSTLKRVNHIKMLTVILCEGNPEKSPEKRGLKRLNQRTTQPRSLGKKVADNICCTWLQSTLNHQSQMKYCWLKIVPFGQRKLYSRSPSLPSLAHTWYDWHLVQNIRWGGGLLRLVHGFEKEYYILIWRWFLFHRFCFYLILKWISR